MSVQLTTPIGRLVGGHPMTRQPITKDGKPVMQADNVTPANEAYIGVAIPKTPGLDWKQEPWGVLIVQAANEGWTAGQPAMPGFAWKVTDGDSAVPNQANNVPNQKEGYPGHWVLNLSTRMAIKCFHVGKYEPIAQIQNDKEIKPGDYCRVSIEAKANFPAQSPGVYLNPSLFELARPGELIVLTSGPSAADAFGGGGAGHPGGPGTTAAPPAGGDAAPPPVAKADDFLNGGGAAPPPVAELFVHPNGTHFTRAALVKGGWQDAAIDALPRA